MAYAAVVSLMNTIQRLLNSPHISFDFPNREMLESVYEEAQSLQQVLEMSDNKRNGRERMKAWKERMREKVFKLEDVLESHVSQHFLSPPENHTDYEGCSLILFQLNLLALRQDMHCFTDTANKMKEEYYLNEEEEEEDDGGGAIDSLSMDTGENKTEMVGLTAFFDNLVKKVVKCHKFPALLITGMAGIGKTRLAKKILEDSLILRNFESFAFVRMGLEYRLNEVLRAILAQVSPESGTMPVEGDDRVYEYLCTSLKGKKYLIVLDDVWDADFWIDLRRRFPMEGNGSVILVTTRLEKLANSIDCVLYKMPFLKDEESWDLLRVKVFANEVCPRQLEKAGRKIALKCEGLPLMVVTVANLLSKAEKTLEYWNKVATNRQNSVFLEAYHSIFEVLYPSYHYLLQYLKPCFLYMATFPQNYQVCVTRLVLLWQAEGFLEPNPLHCLRYFTMEYMDELASSNLVMECKWDVCSARAICWKLHSVYWHLCKEAAGNERFLQILEVYTDCFKQGIERQRRLAVHCNSLFGIKDVYRLLASISTARSLLCTGEYHQYQVPICLELRLLRVLEAEGIRFYDFPMEVLKLVMLRYLALTCNGHIPPSISKLWNLEYLIISPHQSIKSPAVDSYLPEEIWDLQLLKYLHIKGRNLPDPRGAAELPHLHTLLDVGARTCTKGVLDATPNLVKLRIEIELSPDSAQVHQIFDRVIPHLYQLESLQCVIVNPGLRFGFIVPPPSCSVSSSRLQNLILSGLGYPWESMRQIAKLPFLEVLQLQCYAFCGEKWQVRNDEFTKLVYLIIEDTDLVKWTVESFCFGSLTTITIRNCYKLQNIPSTPSLRKIWLDDCNPLAVVCAKQMETKPRVYVRSSWLGDVRFKP